MKFGSERRMSEQKTPGKRKKGLSASVNNSKQDGEKDLSDILLAGGSEIKPIEY